MRQPQEFKTVDEMIANPQPVQVDPAARQRLADYFSGKKRYTSPRQYLPSWVIAENAKRTRQARVDAEMSARRFRAQKKEAAAKKLNATLQRLDAKVRDR